jgi:hypothetical protein
VLLSVAIRAQQFALLDLFHEAVQRGLVVDQRADVSGLLLGIDVMKIETRWIVLLAPRTPFAFPLVSMDPRSQLCPPL